MRIHSLIVFAALVAAPALAQQGPADPGSDEVNPFARAAYPDAARYRACLAEAGRRPDVALRAAALWRENEGGVPAKHCTAAALLSLERYEEAAAWLDEAAGDLAQGQGLKARGATPESRLVADLQGQAGNAWLLAGDYKRAFAAFSEAIGRLPAASPANIDLWIDRARASAGLGDYDRAVSDLDRVIERVPDQPDVYVLRATAHRYRGALDAAELDLLRALAIDPDNAEALFERGVVRRLSGDDAAARADWERVAELYPGTDTAELALDNLELMRSE